jgi:hypothetical protein
MFVRHVIYLVLVGVITCLCHSVGLAEDAPAGQAAPAKRAPFRKVIPGVEKTIPIDLRAEEVASQHDLIELLHNSKNIGWKPKLNPNSRTLKELATGTTFRQTAYCLEFTFKAPRMIWVDVPQASGKMQRKLIWYLLYHVKNPGGQLKPVAQPDGTFQVEKVDEPVTFDPHFVLESLEYRKAYLDRVIPVAVEAIRQKEDPNRPLLNTVEMAATPIAVSTDRADQSKWGVATWEDVDPRIDFFAIDVQGLSNALRWVDPPGAYQKGDPPGKGRVLTQKTLRLNFWRPGDEYAEDERSTQFGIPGKVDYEWVYR